MDGKDMAYQNKSSAYVLDVRQLFYLASVRCAFEPIRVTKIVLHHADSCVLKTWICPFLFGFIQKQFVYILKMKSIQAFMNGNKILSPGLCHRLMTDFGHGHRWPSRWRGFYHPWPCTKPVINLWLRPHDKLLFPFIWEIVSAIHECSTYFMTP